MIPPARPSADAAAASRVATARLQAPEVREGQPWRWPRPSRQSDNLQLQLWPRMPATSTNKGPCMECAIPLKSPVLNDHTCGELTMWSLPMNFALENDLLKEWAILLTLAYRRVTQINQNSDFFWTWTIRFRAARKVLRHPSLGVEMKVSSAPLVRESRKVVEEPGWTYIYKL